MRPFLVAVMGPTGSGKTSLAEWLAETTGAQLLNADAFTIYRGFDIGTNKPIETRDRYRLLDIRAPNQDFGVGEYVLLAAAELERLYAEDRSAIVVGGSGLYVRALLEEWDNMRPAPDPELRATLESTLESEGLDSLVERLRAMSPEAATKTDLRNPVRVRRAIERLMASGPSIEFSLPPFRKFKLALVPPTRRLDDVLAHRTQELLKRGWLQEVARLREEGVSADAPAMRAIGYRSLLGVLEGRDELSSAVLRISLDTRQYAKRQRTWLRSEPNLRQFDSFDVTEVRSEVLRSIEASDRW